ncbi:hypothetical protein GOQ29_11245 [Clostridium sp. D2Q-14]|uniref:pilus assembly FimT family protein n=1 Tax=Anaeromonas gelatinilytica TaxID=2683194 RepID=UPI00193BBEDE|nr:hypothetical protein [Anaeromonas gelatinilytica]MBS4536191.1 hypothetical protein [Anaeromonas gelatinilytica]
MNLKFMNNKGSTLLIVLIVFSILTMLGTTLYTIAVNNYKVENVNEELKKNLYLAEAGVEEAYSLIVKTIYEAINEGNKEASKVIKNIDLSDMKNDYITEDNSINFNKLMENQEIVFKSVYKSYLNENLIKNLENEANYNLIEKDHHMITTDYDNSENIIKVTSVYTKENIKKKVTVSYKLLEPMYNQIYYYESNVVKVPKDTLISKVLCTEKNLINNSKQLEINGDSHIRKNFLVGSYDHSPVKEVIINGNVIVQRDMKMNSKKNKNITLNGTIHSENFIINENSNIEIHELYTKDDLEIYGNKSIVNIFRYFGYTDGREATKSSESSSINIQSEDLGKENGTSLNIIDEMRILGTAFIEKTGDTKYKDWQYQTGESITINENYLIYTDIYSELQDLYYKDYPPFVFVEGDLNKGKFKPHDKAYHFSNNYDKFKGLTLGGRNINIPEDNITTLGVTMDDGNIKEPVGDIDLSKEKLSKEVEKLNGELKQGIINRLDINSNKNNNFSVSEDGEIFCITDKDIYISGYDNYLDRENFINGKNNLKGLIVTSGKVIFSGDVNFTGIIIAGDDIVMTDNSIIKLKYDKDYLLSLLGKNLTIIKDLFKEEPEEYIPTLIYENLGIKNNNVNIDKFIELESWESN